MRNLRRALLAVGVAGLIAAVLRMTGAKPRPMASGGWRELAGPDLR